MTAYVNDEQKKEGAYGKAVKATLAATLAAGMVPAAAAFADEPAEAAEGNDVEVLAANPADLWQGGVFAMEDNNGNVVELKKDAAGAYKTVELTFNGENQLLVPVSVDPEGDETTVESLKDNKDYKVYYQYNQNVDKPEDGTWNNVQHPQTVGLANNRANLFRVVVEAVAGPYKGAKQAFQFKFVDAESDLADATLYQVGKDADFSDTTFEYTGKKYTKDSIGLLYKGAKVENVTDLEFYGNKGTVDALNAGTYTVVATIDGKKVTLNEKLTISKIDLSKAKYEFGTSGATFGDRKIVKIDGFDDETAIANLFDIECAWPNPMDGNAKGEYKYTVKVKANADKAAAANFEGEGAAANVNATNPLKADAFKYGKDALKDVTVDLSAGEKFDLSKISVMRDGSNSLDSKFVKVTVLDKDGNVVDASKLNETGVWTVKVSVDAAATEYMYAGEATCKVTVTNGMIATEDVLFALDGKAVNGTASVKYDGTDVLKKLSVSAKAGDKQLVQGTDFDLKVVKDGAEVKEAVEAGVYTITLTSDKYDFAAKKEQLVLTIDSIQANDFQVAAASLLHGEEGSKKIGYTGDAIAPVVQYDTGEKDSDKKVIWKDLPAGSYALTLEYAEKDKNGKPGTFKKVKEMKELGFYKVSVKDAVKDDSIAISGKELGTFEVVEGKVFADVKPGDWFYDYVYAASDDKVKYMTGIGGTELFAPNQTTTRAMAATVLSRMAVFEGAKAGDYMNPFTDVAYTANPDKDPWYANAVLWAASTGVVTGYPGTTEFRPGNDVTRAEFCIMMQRYAAATG
ncbi:MAG: S-layer homology domain-containing protein, partial [Slackia faecicanis]|nr:S-layer homology domain-containing protein [Slackia faecicanis]